jgi:hypothetical protein
MYIQDWLGLGKGVSREIFHISISKNKLEKTVEQEQKTFTNKSHHVRMCYIQKMEFCLKRKWLE